MPFNQDDAREQMMRGACNIKKDADGGRYGEDGYLEVEHLGTLQRLLFELKSAPENDDFGTGRDTGLAQLRRWSGMHFVFAWIPPREMMIKRLWYASPSMLRGWNDREQAYIKLDLALVDQVPPLATEHLLHVLLGEKSDYTFDELNLLVKDQWNRDVRRGRPASLYEERADVHRDRQRKLNRYSHAVALIALEDRVRYLLDRGATVNNRKIGKRYVLENCVELNVDDAAASLRGAVQLALGDEAP